jgi:hypothetical protein
MLVALIILTAACVLLALKLRPNLDFIKIMDSQYDLH